jgi:hypothetical protein
VTRPTGAFYEDVFIMPVAANVDQSKIHTLHGVKQELAVMTVEPIEHLSYLDSVCVAQEHLDLRDAHEIAWSHFYMTCTRKKDMDTKSKKTTDVEFACV